MVGGRGPVHLFRGGAQFGGTARLSAGDADTTIFPPMGVSLGSAMSLGGCSCKGQAMATGDLTDDGTPDLIIGAPLVDRLSGEVFLIAGPLPLGAVDLAASPRLSIRAAVDDGRLGWSVAVGHLDGDGRPDLAMAAPWADVPGRADAGLLMGIRGPLAAEGDLRLEQGQAALLVEGPQPQSGLAGMTISLADTDGDGAADLHLGFPDDAPLNRRSVGALYRVPGPLLVAVGPTLTPSAAATATTEFTSTPPPETAVPSTPSATATEWATPQPSATATPEPTATVAPSPPSSATPTPAASALPTESGNRRRLWLPQLLRPRRR